MRLTDSGDVSLQGTASWQEVARMRDRRAVLAMCLASLFAPLHTAMGRPPPPSHRQPTMHREAFRRRFATNAPTDEPKAPKDERALSPLPHQAQKDPPDWP